MAQEKQPVPKRVLVIYSYHEGLPWEKLIDENLRATLASESTEPIELNVEHADRIRYSDEAYLKDFVDILRLKYTSSGIDAIIGVDDEATNILLQYGEELFPGVPIVFVTAERKTMQRNFLKPNMTSILWGPDIKGSVDLIGKTLPKTRHIFIITGSSVSDRAAQNLVRQELRGYAGPIKIDYLEETTLNDLLEKVAGLPEHSALLYIAFSRDSEGKSFIPREVLSDISAEANAPIFGILDTYIGYGIVGGILLSGEVQGRRCAEICLRILGGESPMDFVPEQSANVTMFDWRQLDRWGINERDLPEGSIVRYKVPTVWKLYRWQIIGVTLTVVFLSCMTIFLTAIIVGRKRIETRLVESERKYRELVEDINDVVYSVDTKGTVIYVNSAIKSLIDYEPHEVIGKHFSDLVHPDDLQTMKDGFKASLADQAGPSDYRLLRKNGSVAWIRAFSKAIRDDNNCVIAINGIATDITERRKIEEELRVSSEMFKNVAEGIYLVGLDDGIIKWVNPRFEKMFGYEPGEMIGRDVSIVNAPTDGTPEETKREIIGILRETGEWHGEVKNIKKDGTPFWCYANISIFEHPEYGNVCISVHTDITQRKKVEESLKESENEKSLILNSTREIIAFHDLDHSLQWVNKAYLEATGLSLSQVKGRKCYHVWGLDRLCTDCPILKTMETGEPHEYELTPQNQEHWPPDQGCWMVRATPVKNNDGSIIGAIEVAYDITERKKAEEQLIKAEQRYRTVADFTYDWEYWQEPEGAFKYISPSCERITGYTQEEFVSNKSLLEDIILEQDKDIWDQRLKNMIQEQSKIEIEFRIKRKDGEVRWIEHVCQSVKDKDGIFLGFRASNRDITLRKEVEQKIKKSQDSLRFLAGKLITAQEEERRRLAREMHDDLTQRLALLSIEAGNLEIESQKYDSSMHANLQEMKKKLIKLSKDIHDISRQIHPSILDDLGLVDAVKSECTLFTQREGIHVEYKANNLPSFIPRDVKICTYRIIQEGLRNISRHAKTDKAYVSLTCNDSNLFLTIRDNGIGFDISHMQGQKGIGLKSIEERIWLIQGEFSVQSKPGEGTVIKVKAPYTKEPE